MYKIIVTMTLLIVSLSLHAESGFVVISSIESDIPRGAMLERSRVIDLNSGAALTLISANGRVIQLKGPYKGAIDSDTETGGADILQSISSLVQYSKDEDLSLAAFRNISLNNQANLIAIWGIAIETSGQYCIREDLPLNLWWPGAFKGAVITLFNTKTLKQEKFRWTSKQQHIKWPSGFDIQEGTTYTIKNNVANQDSQFSLMKLPDGITGDMGKVVWMFENACQPQAIRLLKDLIRPPGSIKE